MYDEQETREKIESKEDSFTEMAVYWWEVRNMFVFSVQLIIKLGTFCMLGDSGKKQSIYIHIKDGLVLQSVVPSFFIKVTALLECW